MEELTDTANEMSHLRSSFVDVAVRAPPNLPTSPLPSSAAPPRLRRSSSLPSGLTARGAVSTAAHAWGGGKSSAPHAHPLAPSVLSWSEEQLSTAVESRGLPLYNTNVRSCGHPQRLYVKLSMAPDSVATGSQGTPSCLSPQQRIRKRMAVAEEGSSTGRRLPQASPSSSAVKDRQTSLPMDREENGLLTSENRPSTDEGKAVAISDHEAPTQPAASPRDGEPHRTACLVDHDAKPLHQLQQSSSGGSSESGSGVAAAAATAASSYGSPSSHGSLARGPDDADGRLFPNAAAVTLPSVLVDHHLDETASVLPSAWIEVGHSVYTIHHSQTAPTATVSPSTTPPSSAAAAAAAVRQQYLSGVSSPAGPASPPREALADEGAEDCDGIVQELSDVCSLHESEAAVWLIGLSAHKPTATDGRATTALTSPADQDTLAWGSPPDVAELAPAALSTSVPPSSSITYPGQLASQQHRRSCAEESIAKVAEELAWQPPPCPITSSVTSSIREDAGSDHTSADMAAEAPVRDNAITSLQKERRDAPKTRCSASCKGMETAEVWQAAKGERSEDGAPSSLWEKDDRADGAVDTAAAVSTLGDRASGPSPHKECNEPADAGVGSQRVDLDAARADGRDSDPGKAGPGTHRSAATAAVVGPLVVSGDDVAEQPRSAEPRRLGTLWPGGKTSRPSAAPVPQQVPVARELWSDVAISDEDVIVGEEAREAASRPSDAPHDRLVSTRGSPSPTAMAFEDGVAESMKEVEPHVIAHEWGDERCGTREKSVHPTRAPVLVPPLPPSRTPSRAPETPEEDRFSRSFRHRGSPDVVDEIVAAPVEQGQRRALPPPLPPSPVALSASSWAYTNRAPAMPRARDAARGATLGLVSAGLFADELLQREVLESAETAARTMLQRICQCMSDAFCPLNIEVQETVAWQRLMGSEVVARQRLQSLENSLTLEMSELMTLARELALCRMKEESRRQEMAKAEQTGRQRLRELHWRSLAAQLRQRELLESSIDIALRGALDDVQFDEAQAREMLRVEAIRGMTAVLESASGAAVRAAQQRRRLGRRCSSQGASDGLPPASTGALTAEAVPTALQPHLPSSGGADPSSTAVTVGDAAWRQTKRALTAVVFPIDDDVRNEDGLEEEKSSVVDVAVAPDDAEPSSTSSTTTDSSFSTSPASSIGEPASAEAVSGAPHFFEWNPTSNSRTSPSTASKTCSSQRQRRQQAPQLVRNEGAPSTASPSPHLTNATTLTVTNTTTNTTTSSGNHGAANVVSTSESQRSPTTVLSRAPQQPLQGKSYSTVSRAEANALLHALQYTEAAVQKTRHATRAAATKDAAVTADPPLYAEEVVSARDTNEGQQHASHCRRRSRSRSVPRTERSSPLINRHTIPCSLHTSPHRSYHALLRKYSPRGDSPGSPLTGTAAPALSPTSSSSGSARRYTDADVYFYDPQKTRCAQVVVPPPSGTAADEEETATWDGSRLDPSPGTPNQNLFPDQPRWLKTVETPPSMVTDGSPVGPRVVLEVITERKVTVPSAAAAAQNPPVTGGVAPLLHSADRLCRSPRCTTGPQSQAAPTASSTVRAFAQRLLLDGLRGSGAGKAPPLRRPSSPSPSSRSNASSSSLGSGGEAEPSNVRQGGCSQPRRRWPSEEEGRPDAPPLSRSRSNPLAAPLLITRLPLERGPGVWVPAVSPSPHNADGGRHCTRVLATTTPPRHHPAPATLEDAFAQATRTGGVVYLPTDISELLHVPQHVRLPSPRVANAPRQRSREARPAPPPLLGQQQQTSRGGKYNYVDAFYRQQQRSPRGFGSALGQHASGKPSPSVGINTSIAARCAAVRQREAEHEQRQELRWAPPPPPPHLEVCSPGIALESWEGSLPASGPLALAEPPACDDPFKGIPETFEDERALVWGSAVASLVGRRLADEHRRRHAQEPRQSGTANVPAFSRATPTAASSHKSQPLSQKVPRHGSPVPPPAHHIQPADDGPPSRWASLASRGVGRDPSFRLLSFSSTAAVAAVVAARCRSPATATTHRGPTDPRHRQSHGEGWGGRPNKGRRAAPAAPRMFHSD